MPHLLTRGLILLVPLLVEAQISQPPEFQGSPKFRTNPNTGTIDGTSHISAEREQINEELVKHLRRLDGYADGVRLIDNHMVAAAQDEFRKKHLEIGLAVTQFLLGQEEASSAGLCLLAEKQPRYIRLLPFLGSIVGAVPTYAERMLGLIRETAMANPNSSEAQFYLAQGLLKQTPARTTEAMPLLHQSAKLDKKETRALMELGRQYTLLGQLPNAIDSFKETLSRDAALAAAHYRLSQLYRLTGQKEQSLEHLRQFQKLQESKP